MTRYIAIIIIAFFLALLVRSSINISPSLRAQPRQCGLG